MAFSLLFFIVQRLRQIRNSLENDLVAKKTKSVQQKIVESLVSKPGKAEFPSSFLHRLPPFFFDLSSFHLNKRQKDKRQNSSSLHQQLEDQKNKRALDSREQILDDFERDAKKRKNLTVAGAYRLLSRNVLVVDKDHVGVRFETFFQGSYQDRFYVIFQQEPESGLFSVWRHTLPAFVPLKQLEKEHLNRKFDVRAKKHKPTESIKKQSPPCSPPPLGFLGHCGGTIASVCGQEGADPRV